MHTASALNLWIKFFALSLGIFSVGFGLLHASAETSAAPSTEFQVFLAPTIQYAHDDIWSKTPSGRGPGFAVVDKVARGQSLQFLVLASNYQISADQMAEASCNIAFTKPDGTPGSKKDHLPLIPRRAATDGRLLQKAPETVGIIFSPNDPLGEWTVTVEATDLVGKTTAQVKRKFSVIEASALEQSLPADTEPGRWIFNYHNEPAPHQVLAIVKRWTEDPQLKSTPQRMWENGSWLGFFEQVIADNPWLVPLAVQRMEHSVGDERACLAASLAYAKRDDAAFMKSLSLEARGAISVYQNQRWPIPNKEPLTGHQLDVLWGRFFASGRYQPIRDLVAVLSYHPYSNAVEDYKKLNPKPKTPPPEFLKGIVFGAVVWSLTSNIQQDKVARDYCEGIFIRKELPEKEHAVLVTILAKAIENMKKGAAGNPTAPQKNQRKEKIGAYSPAAALETGLNFALNEATR